MTVLTALNSSPLGGKRVETLWEVADDTPWACPRRPSTNSIGPERSRTSVGARHTDPRDRHRQRYRIDPSGYSANVERPKNQAAPTNIQRGLVGF